MPKEKCFIIAPISTQAERAALYLNDADHCEHVIDHLLAPAVEKAGFEPIRPKAKGANLIHAEIVRNLQTAALVLCDMSGLNPNVFFELGIRTAMNKPICLTIDQATNDAPFDLDLINHHKYVSDLRPWVLPQEVEKLAAHLKESADAKENELWKYFSLRITAESASGSLEPQDKTDLLLSEVSALRRQMAIAIATKALHDPAAAAESTVATFADASERNRQRRLFRQSHVLNEIRNMMGMNLWKYTRRSETKLDVWIDPKGVTPERLAHINELAASYGVEITVNISDFGATP